MLLLPPRHLHLWVADQRTLDGESLDDYREWLSDAERERLEGMQNPQTARRYLLTRAVLRYGLSQYADSMSPADWQFTEDDNGKPQLHDAPMDLGFNLSHSGDWIALAVTPERAVGVDVEQLGRKREEQLLAIAEHYFHPEEVEQLHAREGDERRLLFFQLWTLKEAWLKARGTGLATGLSRVHLSLEADGSVELSTDASLKEDDDQWQFHHYHLGEDYYLACALQQPPAQTANVHLYKALPLRDDPVSLEVQARHIRVI